MTITSQPAVLMSASGQLRMHGYHHLFSRVITNDYRKMAGILHIGHQHLQFEGEGNNWKWSYRDLLCITTTGHHLLLKLRGFGQARIEFRHESPLKYQILLREWLSQQYHRESGQTVCEFQPLVRLHPLTPPRKHLKIPYGAERITPSVTENFALRGVAWLVRQMTRPFAKIEIRGQQHWGDGMGGCVLMNHQSTADPFLFGAFFDRRTAFLTKSTVFAHTFTRFFMRWARGIPTTRHQGDFPVILHIRKLLSVGLRVGIFPEGERTWDGKLLPFRMGTVKLLMALRVPIYPVIINGAFELWPRWAKWPSRQNVIIRICPPFVLLNEPWSVDEQRQYLENYFQSVLQSLK